ncbi:response regulator [Ramlibacter albus]|uniref:Response regulator n=1 Tax=Ramlibacter albus TaxID=2079448 RepID=A0A923S419_9BURK|nr:response regulator [Ramlibacter albus]MBC5767016.1 response regulator [Ramlibacter albus]
MTPDASVLVVEDDPAAVELLEMACRATGLQWSMHVAGDGPEALALLHRIGTCPALQPALVLLDLCMPRMSGVDVLRVLRGDARTRGLPVVVFSASDRECDRRDAIGAGASAFETKPMRFADLCRAVERLDREWLLGGRP